MVTKEKGLGYTTDRLMQRAVGILYHRDQYFMDMINQFRKRYPALRILYANSQPGAVFDPDNPKPDFLMIVKGRMISKDPKMAPDRPIILIDAPVIFSDRSIAGWTLAVEDGNKDGYFQYMLDKMLRLPEQRFIEYIVHMCPLSTKKESELYWKSPANTDKLVKEIMELYARYNTSSPDKMANTRGYTKEAMDARKAAQKPKLPK